MLDALGAPQSVLVLGATSDIATATVARLAARGYRSEAWHSFDGRFFDRAAWYPNIGFAKLRFGPDLIQGGAAWCPGVFPGACDRDVPRQMTAALKAATSDLIGRFCVAAETATRQRYGDGPLVRYAADLVVPERERAECALLKAVAARYVMARDGVVSAQEREREVVADLVRLLADRPAALGPLAAEDFAAAGDDAGRLRAVVDQVAVLVWDAYAAGGGDGIPQRLAEVRRELG